MIEKLAWILVIAGLGFAAYSGYELYSENAQVEDVPDEAIQIDPSRNDMTIKPSVNVADSPKMRDRHLVGKKPMPCGYSGFLYIPRFNKKMPYVFGTSDQCLKKGLGLMIRDVLVYPGETGRVIMSGHRDTHFRIARDFKIGERFIVTFVMKPDRLFIYQFKHLKIIDKDAVTEVKSVPKPELCLTTCYPFGFTGNAPQRYVMCGPLIEIKSVSRSDWEKYTIKKD